MDLDGEYKGWMTFIVLDKQVIPGISCNRLQWNIKEQDKTIVANIDDKSKNFKQLL